MQSATFYQAVIAAGLLAVVAHVIGRVDKKAATLFEVTLFISMLIVAYRERNAGAMWDNFQKFTAGVWNVAAVPKPTPPPPGVRAAPPTIGTPRPSDGSI